MPTPDFLELAKTQGFKVEFDLSTLEITIVFPKNMSKLRISSLVEALEDTEMSTRSPAVKFPKVLATEPTIAKIKLQPLPSDEVRLNRGPAYRKHIKLHYQDEILKFLAYQNHRLGADPGLTQTTASKTETPKSTSKSRWRRFI